MEIIIFNNHGKASTHAGTLDVCLLFDIDKETHQQAKEKTNVRTYIHTITFRESRSENEIVDGGKVGGQRVHSPVAVPSFSGVRVVYSPSEQIAGGPVLGRETLEVIVGFSNCYGTVPGVNFVYLGGKSLSTLSGVNYVVVG